MGNQYWLILLCWAFWEYCLFGLKFSFSLFLDSLSYRFSWLMIWFLSFSLSEYFFMSCLYFFTWVSKFSFSLTSVSASFSFYLSLPFFSCKSLSSSPFLSTNSRFCWSTWVSSYLMLLRSFWCEDSSLSSLLIYSLFFWMSFSCFFISVSFFFIYSFFLRRSSCNCPCCLSRLAVWDSKDAFSYFLSSKSFLRSCKLRCLSLSDS